MENTRVDLGKKLDKWEKSSTDAATMMWVYGGAGTGKTALLLTFSDFCKRDGRSIGAFFLSHRIETCNDGNLIFATLAIQLLKALPSTKPHIYKAIRQDPLIFTKGLGVQMKALIVEPIEKVAKLSRFLKVVRFSSYPTLIVIDGLDECSDKGVQSDIIKTIGDAMKDIRLPIHFLIASRPEPNIHQAIDAVYSQFPERVFRINLKDEHSTNDDIRHYFEVKFSEVRKMHPELPLNWPGDDVISRLVDNASGQFVYADTIMTYVMDQYYSPEDRLAVIQGLMEKPTGDEPYRSLDQLYSYILRKAARRDIIMKILAVLIVLHHISSDPASIQLCSPLKLDKILGLKRGDVKRCLTDMHSLVDIGDENHIIHIYHKSFPEFLLDPSRSKQFSVPLEGAYEAVYSHILRTSIHRDTILLVIGQILIAEGMPSHVDQFGTPANATSPHRIEKILRLEPGEVSLALADAHLLFQPWSCDEDIKIRHAIIGTFLVDRSKSRDLYVNLDYARFIRDVEAHIRREFGAQGEGIHGLYSNFY